MDLLRLRLGTLYREDECPERGALWTVRILRLSPWRRLLRTGARLTPALTRLLAGKDNVGEPDWVTYLETLESVLPTDAGGQLAYPESLVTGVAWSKLCRVGQDVAAICWTAQRFPPLYETVNLVEIRTDSRLLAVLSAALRYPPAAIAEALAPSSERCLRRLVNWPNGEASFPTSLRLGLGCEAW